MGVQEQLGAWGLDESSESGCSHHLGFEEKLGFRRYLVLGAYLGCVKYLDTQGVSGCPGSSWGSGAKAAKTHPGFREHLVVGGAVQGTARSQG